MKIRLFKNWWLMTLKGLLAFGYGLILILSRYNIPRTSFVLTFGVLLIASGIMIMTGAFLHKQNNPRWGWWIVEGIIDILIGVLFIWIPNQARAFFLYFLALWAFAIGVIQIITSLRMTNYLDRWWVMLLTGVLSILFAILFFLNPLYTLLDVNVTVGLSCAIFGLILIFNSRTLRNIYL
jgi:uncharacterized membrane protein HdeD (DUF308 family)